MLLQLRLLMQVSKSFHCKWMEQQLKNKIMKQFPIKITTKNLKIVRLKQMINDMPFLSTKK